MASGQPALNEATTLLHAPELVICGPHGQIHVDGPDGNGAFGWYSRDLRMLSRWEVRIDGGRTLPVGAVSQGVAASSFHCVLDSLPGGAADPTVLISRHRSVRPGAMTERIEVSNRGSAPVGLTLRVLTGTDLAGVDAVRSGREVPPVGPRRLDSDLCWTGATASVRVHGDPEPAVVHDGPDGGELAWPLTVPPGAQWTVELTASCEHRPPGEFTQLPASTTPEWTIPDPVSDLLEANLADVTALLLSDPLRPQDVYAAAGSPWYLTLFGRDTLWTARLLLPLGTELAGGTLRALARRQGTRHEREAEEAPGKIPHEVRGAPLHTDRVRLPALYYGTIDATPLWVCLLHDAWRAGLPEDEVLALLPAMTAAMGWVTGPDADPDGDGLLEYHGSAGGGLANQGWKDSVDSIRQLDGGYATAPVALCEVQGYAHAAALGAAALAEAFDLPGGQEWLAWAARLRTGFRDRFWLADEHGDYPAIALDAAKRPVSGASSNMAHLLGTGLLDRAESARVAARLAAQDLRCEYGLRTLTTTSAAYNPMSYHCGSVWPHDTAIAITALAADGHLALADELSEALLRAARWFDGRPPELFGVLDDGTPVHYPTACRPQAWSAAGVVAAALHLAGRGVRSAG